MAIRGASGPAGGVLGRDTELGQIEAWLAQDAAPGPAEARLVLVIEGEPGIGKTTLWTEATARAREAGWHLLSCRPAASDAGLPHVALAALLREEAGGIALDPRAVGTGLTALLGLIGNDGPLMLAVDDAQWLDPASARALGFALRRLDDRQLRLVTAVRTEGPAGQRTGAFATVEGSLDRHAVTRIEVGPLSVAAIHQMFARTLGSSFARPVLVRIHRAAGGNPFYALEIGREVRRLGVPPPSQPLPVPGDHRDLALLRLRRLPRATRDVLAVVAAMARPSTADLDLDALAPAEVAGIVRVRPGGRAEFTHPLFGSALYSSLPEARRRSLHRDLASRATRPEERARHLALTADGPDEATAAALDEAAAAAAARGAADVAVELMELACKLTPPQDTAALVRRETELAERRYFAGDPTGARRELERSLAALPPGEERARVLLELGSMMWVQEEGDEGLALMSRALGEAATPALRARIHSRIASQSDDADVCVAHGEAALALLDEHEDPILYCFALHNLALFKFYSGRGADHAAIEKGMLLQRDLAAWEMSTVPAFWARNFDDFGTARRRFEDILRAFREQGDEATASGVLTHLARVEIMTGHMDRARALVTEALDLAEQTEQETYLLMALCAKGLWCAQAGEREGAKRGDLAPDRDDPGHCPGGHGQGGPRDRGHSGRRPRRDRPPAHPCPGNRRTGAQPRARQQQVPCRPCRGGHRPGGSRPRRETDPDDGTTGRGPAAAVDPGGLGSLPWHAQRRQGRPRPGPVRLPAGAGGARDAGHARRTGPHAARPGPPAPPPQRAAARPGMPEPGRGAVRSGRGAAVGGGGPPGAGPRPGPPRQRRPAHSHRAAGGRACRRRAAELRDRRAAVPVRQDGGGEPVPHLPQTRSPLPHRTRRQDAAAGHRGHAATVGVSPTRRTGW